MNQLEKEIQVLRVKAQDYKDENHKLRAQFDEVKREIGKLQFQLKNLVSTLESIKTATKTLTSIQIIFYIMGHSVNKNRQNIFNKLGP